MKHNHKIKIYHKKLLNQYFLNTINRYHIRKQQLIIFFHQMMKNILIKIINNFIQAKDLFLTVLINQIFSNHTHEMKKYDNLEKSNLIQ